MAAKNKILAHHAHVFPASIRPDGSIEQLLELMSQCGIDEAVCFAPFSYQLEGSSFAGNGNEWLAKELSKHPNLYGFGTLDFSQGNVADQVRQIADLGFRGIKLHPAAQQFNILSPQAMESYEIAEKLDLFVSFHTGVHWHRIKDYDVTLFDEISFHFPQLRFSLEHVGGYHYFAQALAVIVNNFVDHEAAEPKSRVFAGLTSVFTTHYNRYWHLSEERLQELIAQAGIRHLIFGLDFPYNRTKETMIGLGAIKGLKLSEEEQRLILGGNLRRELKID